MCLFPKLIRNKKYTPNKKNNGIVPEMKDNRVGTIPVGCGICMECLKQKGNAWRARLMEEIKHDKSGVFVTLTLSNEEYTKLYRELENKAEGYTLDNYIAKKAVRRFLERWRKKHKRSVKHWLVTELGHEGTENIHLHGIIFTENIKDLREIWKYGFVWDGIKKNKEKINYVTERTINYIMKYVSKVDTDHKYYRPIILCSPGIGRDYVNTYNFEKNKFKGKETNETYKTNNGRKINLPIYWRNKVYTEEEREELWLQKLDKGDRYIGGEKVKGDVEEYNRLLKYYQELNRNLGYGEPENWDAMKYEKERRTLKQKERLVDEEYKQFEKIEPRKINDEDIIPF